MKDAMKKDVEELREDILNYITRRLAKKNESSAVLVNALINILAGMVVCSCRDIESVRVFADRIKSIIIDLGVNNEDLLLGDDEEETF